MRSIIADTSWMGRAQTCVTDKSSTMIVLSASILSMNTHCIVLYGEAGFGEFIIIRFLISKIRSRSRHHSNPSVGFPCAHKPLSGLGPSNRPLQLPLCLTSVCQHYFYSSLRDMTPQKEALQSVLRIMKGCIKKILLLMWIATCKTCPACCIPPTPPPLELCLVVLFIPFKKLSALSMKGACGGEPCDRICWLGETKRKIKQKWRRENGWFQVKQPACALLIWIPGEKVQVTESLLKRTANGGEEKHLFASFCFKELERKTGNKQNRFACLPLKKKGFSVMRWNDKLSERLQRPH